MTKESIDEETMERLKKLGDNLQAVHEDEKNEMVRISEEKYQLSECLDIMSSEIADLQSSIDRQDRQENPQRALDEGAALERMLGAIELGHNHAEQLESEIGNLRKKIEEENVVDVDSTTEMQNACQVLQDHRRQLAEKSNQIDSYAQAIQSIEKKMEGADESQERLSNAFTFAGQLCKRLQECDDPLETTNQSRGMGEMELTKVEIDMELAKVEIDLEFANDCILSESLEAQEAHIKELEEKLFAKDREVEATQQQLQILELAIDANKERARKLELELKAMSYLQRSTSLHRREILCPVSIPAS